MPSEQLIARLFLYEAIYQASQFNKMATRTVAVGGRTRVCFSYSDTLGSVEGIKLLEVAQ